MSRHTKLTPAIQKAVLDAIKGGATPRIAAMHGGVHKDTLNEWIRQGRANPQHPLYGPFVLAFDKASAEAELRNVVIIQNAAKEDWRAAAWWLTHKPDTEWVEKKQIDLKQLSDEQVQRMVAAEFGSGGDSAGD